MRIYVLEDAETGTRFAIISEIWGIGALVTPIDARLLSGRN